MNPEIVALIEDQFQKTPRSAMPSLMDIYLENRQRAVEMVYKLLARDRKIESIQEAMTRIDSDVS